MLYPLDLFGTCIFAVTGAFLGVQKKLDIFGVLVVGFVTAVGGGTVRDVLLGHSPVFWLKDFNYFIAVLLGVLSALILGRRVLRIKLFLSISDAVGLGVFTIIGIRKALDADLLPVFCVMMGVTTSVAGGMIRDILCTESPMVLSREIYATACIAGGFAYFIMILFSLGDNVAVISSIILIILIRIFSIKMNLSLPKRENA